MNSNAAATAAAIAVERSNHVLGAHINERQQHHTGTFLDKTLVAFCYGMGYCVSSPNEQKPQEAKEVQQRADYRRGERTRFI